MDLLHQLVCLSCRKPRERVAAAAAFASLPLLSDDDVQELFQEDARAALEHFKSCRGKAAPWSLCSFSVLRHTVFPGQGEFERVLEEFRDTGKKTLSENGELGRAAATFLGMVIGDALGAPLEFTPVQYGTSLHVGFEDEGVWTKAGCNRFGLKTGQWTDDAAMGIAMAESMLQRGRLDLQDIRMKFLLWWNFGFGNSFGRCVQEGVPRVSVGLGGNIGASLSEFEQNCTAATLAGDSNTSGNGSLMRLAPVPVFFCGAPPEVALDAAYHQSKATHQGEEAAECCRLMTHIVVRAIRSGGGKAVLDALVAEGFDSPLPGVCCLAKGHAEVCPDTGAADPNRNWTWRAHDWTHSPKRAQQSPGYVGSYAMDCLCAALHCVYTTDSFRAALLKAVNLGGDADTVGAVCGQLAGSMYGWDAIPALWLQCVERWTGGSGGLLALRVKLLYELGQKVNNAEGAQYTE